MDEKTGQLREKYVKKESPPNRLSGWIG